MDEGAAGRTVGVFVGDSALTVPEDLRSKHGAILRRLVGRAQTSDKTPTAPVRGADIACASLTEALLRIHPFENCDVYRLPRTKATSGRLWRGGETPEGVSLHNYGDLFREPPRSRCTVWFDPAGIFPLPLQIRANVVRQAYPITSALHALNHHWMLHQWTLPVILGGVKSYDSIVCPSRASKTSLLRIFEHVTREFNREFSAHIRYSGRVDVIPLCVDTEKFRPRESLSLRSLLGIPKDGVLILYLGRLSLSDKADLFPLLLALKRLQMDGAPCKVRLALAGSDQDMYAQALKRQAYELGVGDHAHIIPQVDAAERHLVHAAADIFVCPSDSVLENFPLAALEAMSSGVPQVVADWDGFRDSVQNGETGFRIPTVWTQCDSDLCQIGQVRGLRHDYLALAQSVVVDQDELVERLKILVRDQDLRLKMADLSRQRAVQRYSYEAVMKEYSCLWSELTESARREPSCPRTPLYSQPAYYSWYDHLATMSLDDSAELYPEATAESSFGLKGVLASYGRLLDSGVIDGTILQAALEKLEMLCPRDGSGPDGVRHGATMSELVAMIAGQSARGSVVACRHVMWLIKHGFVRVGHRTNR